MAYVRPNFGTRKELLEALAEGRQVEVFSPSIFPCTTNGVEDIEGPWSPDPHTWYARVKVENGFVTKVK